MAEKYNYLPYNKQLTVRAKELRNSMTLAEKRMWHECLKNFPFKFLRQKPIDNFIVDFYCSELGLVIEIDGGTHVEEKDLIYDKQRTKILESYGLKVLRFWNDDVLNGIAIINEIIESKIKEIHNPLNPPYQGDN